MSYDDRPDSPLYRERRAWRRLLTVAALALLVPVCVLVWLAFSAG